MEQHASSLFVGRWQPFHKGHRTLIETVLKKGKPVVIAIRDTDISHKNPYTAQERWTTIQRAFKKYGELVKIVVIPDIDEICYGRDVGYEIRKIELDSKMHAISGTKTREKKRPMHPVIWLTGQSGAGKSTLAEALKTPLGAVVLDGDEMRDTISLGAGFSKKDREEHNLRVARLATALARQAPVIVSVIAPFRDTREKIDAMLKPIWIHVKRRSQVKNKEYPYEVPKAPDMVIDTDALKPKAAAEKIADFLKKKK
jgi:cytidyltransferase-like protein